tara:strand:+ start:645 stop:980 length:336 start_codon:yes stop_codon:yes gene_type:complete
MVNKRMKNSDGVYVIKGKKYPELKGSRVQVYRGNAFETEGGLQKKDIFKNKHGRYVSLKKHKTAKKEKRLEKAGYKTKKGVFGAVKNNTKKNIKTKKNKKKNKKNKTGKRR